MKFTVLTIFPEMFTSFFGYGIVSRAIQGALISARAVNIRDYTRDRHRTTDDRPYGGGAGMVMKPEPLAAAIREARQKEPETLTVHLSPQGRMLDQDTARELAAGPDMILVCGRYEGIDERVCEDLIDVELSIGDYVLTGGELAAMVVIDAVTRLIPGALGKEASARTDTFSGARLKHAQYTRPPTFEGAEIPEVLRSGNHAEIDRWRLESTLVRTLLKRPDLLRAQPLTAYEVGILRNWRREIDHLID
jgi:tRNA (guanine37-N1)-methyltransferase